MTTNDKKLCCAEIMNSLTELSVQSEVFSSKCFGQNNYEIERIKSFISWPVHYPVDPVRLAKAGFFYTGNEDEVICFSCQGHVRNWNYGDVVQKKHADLFPTCDFVNGRSNNVPITCSKKSTDMIHDQEVSFKNNQKNEVAVEEDAVNNLLSTSSTHVCKIGISDEKHVISTEKNNSPKVSDYHKMESMDERLKTFTKQWPLPFINVSELASAGFYYLGYEDKVQCPFCQGIVSNWEVGDIPLQEHRRHFPKCNYLPRVDSNEIKKQKPWYKNTNQDICGNMTPSAISETTASKSKLLDKNQRHVNLQRLGVHLHKGPAHPQQATLTARLRSFIIWPSTAPISKEDLAEAGFFYVGISDHTKCFHCDGGLCNWEEGDTPWVEHARWFRNCDFLNLNRKVEFIEECLEKYPIQDVESSASAQNSHHFSPEYLMTKVDEDMKSHLVKSVLEAGLFPSYIVRAAILRQLKESGSAFSNIDELCMAASFLKAEMESDSLEIDDAQSLNLNICRTTEQESDQAIPEVKLLQKTSTAADITEKIKICPGTTVEEQNKPLKDQCICKICMDREVGVVFLPCGHLLACTLCAPALKMCPMCRKTIQATVRAYLP